MSLTDAWYPLRYHPEQARYWRSPARFKAVAAGRGSGKTELARRFIVRMLPVIKPWNDPLYAYALPTYPQAERVAWPALKALIPPKWIADINESKLRIRTKFGSTLYVFGMDKPQRAEGSQYDGVIIDESSDQKPTVFSTSFLPALSHRQAFCHRIGVPKRMGIGAPDFKEFFERGLKGDCIGDDPNLRIESFTWPSEDIVDPAVIQFARETLDEKDFKEQYCASWEDAGGLIYYAYDDVLNVREVQYNPNIPICIGSDFNVSPMSWVIGHRYEKHIEIFDMLYLRDVSTQQTLDILYEKYGKTHKAGFEFFGDATGRARKTSANSAAQSDYLLIRADERFKGARIFYNKSNPAIVDRFAACNAKFCNAAGHRQILIHPRCAPLRKDLLSRAYKPGTREPDNSDKESGHASDSLGYFVHKIFPVQSVVGNTQQVTIRAS